MFWYTFVDIPSFAPYFASVSCLFFVPFYHLSSGVARTTEPKKEEPKKSSFSLNASAKPFKFNPEVKEFVPGSYAAPTTAPALAPVPAPSFGGKGGKNYSGGKGGGKGGGGGYGGGSGAYGGADPYGNMYPPPAGANGIPMGGPGYAVMPATMVGGGAAYGQANFPRGAPMGPGGIPGGAAPAYGAYAGGFLQPGMAAGGANMGGYMAPAGGAYYPAMAMPQGAMGVGGSGGMYAPGQQPQGQYGSGGSFDSKKKKPTKGKELSGSPPTQPPDASEPAASGGTSGP